MGTVPKGTKDILLFILGAYSLNQKADNTEFEFKPTAMCCWPSYFSEPQLFNLYTETSQDSDMR